MECFGWWGWWVYIYVRETYGVGMFFWGDGGAAAFLNVIFLNLFKNITFKKVQAI